MVTLCVYVCGCNVHNAHGTGLSDSKSIMIMGSPELFIPAKTNKFCLGEGMCDGESISLT